MTFSNNPLYFKSDYWGAIIEVTDYDKYVAIGKVIEHKNPAVVGTYITVSIEGLATWDDITSEYLIKKDVEDWLK
jgi:hypothetical protein